MHMLVMWSFMVTHFCHVAKAAWRIRVQLSNIMNNMLTANYTMQLMVN